MKKRLLILSVICFTYLNAQNFNDFYIKQQFSFYETDDSALNALNVVKNFILLPNKLEYVEDCNSDYCSEFMRLFFNENMSPEDYHYVPTVYYKKDHYIVFEIDVIESINIDNKIENVVYQNVLLPVNLLNNKISLNVNNLKILPNINIASFDGINIISNNKNDYKENLSKIKEYIDKLAEILYIPQKDLKKSNLTIISSSTLNDGYYYYGINKYIAYVNNYRKDKIFAGTNSIFYKHEIIHYLVSLKNKGEINAIISEGLATWLGGSMNLSYEDFIALKTKKLSEEELKNIIDDFIKDIDSSDDYKYDYFLRAVFVSSIFNNSYKNIDKETLESLISSNIENNTIQQIVELIGANPDELKSKMLNEIRRIKIK